jgi:hypothetical protein
MATKFPNNIDGYSELPLLTNLISEIDASDLNNLITTIIKIQQVFGTDPQGVYGTVKARFEAVEEILNNYSYFFLPEQIGAPDVVSDSGILYSKDIDGYSELHYLDNYGNEIQITQKGTLL